MKKEFVPYEQALALKELGFDEPCFANMFDYSKSHMNTDVPNRIRFYNVEFSKDFNKHYEPIQLIDTDIFVSIPLYQQAFKWFREKYNLVKQPICLGENKWRVKDQEEIIMEKYLLLQNIHTYNDYNTFEEAELECLKKLIKIVKNEK